MGAMLLLVAVRHDQRGIVDDQLEGGDVKATLDDAGGRKRVDKPINFYFESSTSDGNEAI